MAIVAARSSKGRLHKSGKDIIWVSNYLRGKQFIGAALLVASQPGVYNYVVLHLLCTGIELLLKGLLLQRDFDKYRPKLRSYGHDLTMLVRAASGEFRVKNLHSNTDAQLVELNKFYSKHLTRYSGLHDIFIDHRSIRYELVVKRILAIVRLAERNIRNSPEVISAFKFQLG